MTMWFDKKVGQEAINEEECAVVIGTPDWVRVPNVGQKRVLGTFQRECPQCHAPGRSHYQLEDGYGVAECQPCGFVFYKSRSEIQS